MTAGRGLTEEVPGAVETLRCPTCLNRLADGGAKHCPACGARVRRRRGANVVSDDAVFNRPRVLVERELQARIEAQTAAHFLQRRRAAKTARRIAALPPSLFESGVVVEPTSGAWSPLPPSGVIDIPVNAIHETPRPAELLAPPTAPTPADEVVAPRRRWRLWKPTRNGDHRDEPEATDTRVDVGDGMVDDDVVDAVEAEAAPAEEVEVVEAAEAPEAPSPVASDPEPPPEESPSRAGRAAMLGARWRAWKATRNRPGAGNGEHADTEDDVDIDPGNPPVVEGEPAVAENPYDWETDEGADRGARPRLRIPDHWRTWRPLPREPEPDAPGRAAAATAPAPPPPPPARRRGRVEPRDVAPAAHAPRGAENWEPSESLWARRVFNSRAQRSDVANWPPPRPPKRDVATRE